MNENEIKEMQKYIEQIQQSANTLVENSQEIQAIKCNAERILASVYMLRINITDIYSD